MSSEDHQEKHINFDETVVMSHEESHIGRGALNTSVTHGSIINSSGLQLNNSFTDLTLTWSGFLRDLELSDEDETRYAKLFRDEDMPLPSHTTSQYMTNDFLMSMGVTKAGHRAKLIQRAIAISNTSMNSPGMTPSSTKKIERRTSEMQNLASTLHLFPGRKRHRVAGNHHTSLSKDVNMYPSTKVTRRVFKSESVDMDNFTWVDMTGWEPTFLLQLNQLAEEYDMDQSLQEEFPKTMQMPEVVTVENQHLVVLRVASSDGQNGPGDNIRALTSRWMIFLDQDQGVIMTFHRHDHEGFAMIRRNWDNHYCRSTFKKFYERIVDTHFMTFHDALVSCEHQMDAIEERIFDHSINRSGSSRREDSLSRKLFTLQRKASVYTRVLSVVDRALPQMLGLVRTVQHPPPPLNEALKRELQDLQEQSAEVHENVKDMLDMHLALVSHRTNELMNVLTLVSTFFVPLSFVTGFFSMNFEKLPENKWEGSYYVVIGGMIFLCLLTYIFFRRRQLI